MTTWIPTLEGRSGPIYQQIVDALKDDVAAGRLAAGAQLPTHREMARALKVTVVTVSRAYAEAARQGLIRGEVGRGTFVSALPAEDRRSAPREDGPIDLSLNHLAFDLDALPAAAREEAARGFLGGLGEFHQPGGLPEHRAAGALWLRRPGFLPTAEQTLVTSGGQHAMLVVLAALCRPGDTVLVESLTYPGIKSLAQHLSLRLQPIPLDGEGLHPEALEEAASQNPGRVLYCQPTLHNPTSATMPEARRRRIAEIAREHDLTILEDDIYGFLLPEAPPPLAAFAPERTCYFVGCSKGLGAGLRVGFLAAPEKLQARLRAEIGATVWYAAPSLVALVSRWIGDGTARFITEGKRRETAARQDLARRRLAGLEWESHPASSHVWLTLPEPWEVASFLEAARERGVLVNPAEAFVAGRSAVPPAVRICLGPVKERARLDQALGRIVEILASQRGAVAAVV
jgi:DNA-binding transcriptional MocR family regulator